MARRRVRSSDQRPAAAVPPELVECWVEDWVEPGETLLTVAAKDDPVFAAMSNARRRWHRARVVAGVDDRSYPPGRPKFRGDPAAYVACTFEGYDALLAAGKAKSHG